MCHLEEVYHTPCGHWADRPRVRQPCPRTRAYSETQSYGPPTLPNSEQSTFGRRMAISCHSTQLVRSSVNRESKCPKCRIDVDKIASKQSGMWFSFYRDPVTKKMKYKDREGESPASKAARTGSRKKLTKYPPKQRRKDATDSSHEAGQGGDSSRSSSWSSHGHVEL